MKATAFAPTNIALAKYWGKRDSLLNLPTNSSLSIAIPNYGSTTTVTFSPDFKKDRLFINAEEITEFAGLKKVTKVLNVIRSQSEKNFFALIESTNNFPTGAGLASSASGLAALTLAATKALSLDLSDSKISEIARIGSGSACRSIFSGYVEWKRGELSDGTDSIAQTILKADEFPLDCTIAVINAEKKHTLSTDGMIQTQETSPYFEAWTSFAHQSTQKVKKALLEKDFIALANEVEANCIKMHASAMAANPPILYWQPATISVIDLIRKLRTTDALGVFFTIDAGPNVVVFSEPSHTRKVREALNTIDGIVEILK